MIDLFRKEAKSPKQAAGFSGQVLRNFVAAFIEYPKPLIAVLNGPAVGIGATFLPLCDAVFMSDKATLKTPFGSTAQAPEGCSSYTFPKILGKFSIYKFQIIPYFFKITTIDFRSKFSKENAHV